MNFKDDGIIKIANIDKIGESKEVVVFNPKFKVVSSKSKYTTLIQSLRLYILILK